MKKGISKYIWLEKSALKTRLSDFSYNKIKNKLVFMFLEIKIKNLSIEVKTD